MQFLFRKVRDQVLEETNGRQEPFTYGSLPGKAVYLIAPQDEPEAAQPKVDQSVVDLAYWNAIKDTKDPVIIRSYLEKFPSGQFNVLARAMLNRIKAAADAGQLDQTKTLSPPPVFPNGVYQSNLNEVSIKCYVNGKCTGSYAGTGDDKPATIFGKFSNNGKLTGYWIESKGDQPCAKKFRGSNHWGKILFQFNISRTDWDGRWSYCQAKPNFARKKRVWTGWR